MVQAIETHLVTRHSSFPTVCVLCNKTIPVEELHYVEEGTKEHLHSLIARKFCHACYKKYGEDRLLTEKNK